MRMDINAKTLSYPLGKVHEQIRNNFPSIVRVAVALYDPKTDEINTFTTKLVPIATARGCVAERD
jgi:hypothetical protein